MAREAVEFAAFLLLAVFLTWPLSRDLGGATLAGPDPMADLWTIDWLSGHLLRPSSLFGGNVFAPAPHAVVYSDLSLGTAVLVAPLRLLVHDPVPLYNLSVLVALAFGGWSFSLLARRLTGNPWSGLLSGVLSTFTSHQMSHIYHVNLLTIGWLALLLLGLHDLFEAPSFASLALTGVSFSLSAQSSGYYALAAVLLCLVFVLAHLRSLGRKGVLRGLILALLLALLLTAPYAWAFLAVRRAESLRRPLGMSAHMAFHPRQDFTSLGYLYAPWLGSGGERLFPGALALGLAGLALVRKRPHARLYAAAAGLLLLVSLGPETSLFGHSVPLPYRLLFAVPPFNAMRHPYTFAAVSVFLLAVLAGLGWESLPFGRSAPAGCLVVALAVAEVLCPSPLVLPVPRGIPPAYALLAGKPRGVILEVPPFEPQTVLWAARHGWEVANGVGAFAPGRTLALERTMENHWIDATPRDLDNSKPMELLLGDFPVRYLILPSGRKPSLRRLAPAFDASAHLSLLGVAEDGDRVYEVGRLADPGEGGK